MGQLYSTWHLQLCGCHGCEPARLHVPSPYNLHSPPHSTRLGLVLRVSASFPFMPGSSSISSRSWLFKMWWKPHSNDRSCAGQGESWANVRQNPDGDDGVGKRVREVISVLQGEICVSSNVISVRTQRIFLFIIQRGGRKALQHTINSH